MDKEKVKQQIENYFKEVHQRNRQPLSWKDWLIVAFLITLIFMYFIFI